MLDDEEVMGPNKRRHVGGDSIPERIVWSVLTAAVVNGMLLLVQAYFSNAHDSTLNLVNRVNALEMRDAAKTEQISENRRTFEMIDGRLRRIEEHLLRPKP